MSNILELHPQANPVSHLIRIGHTGFRKLESLYAARRVALSHVVVDASHLVQQQDLVGTLAADDVEIILDTKAAELAGESGWHSSARKLPWAGTDGWHRPNDWADKRGRARVEYIAEFAVQTGVDAVLSPSHFVPDTKSPWLFVDQRSTHWLRQALDRRGGGRIRIDYHLTVPVGLLRKPDQIQELIDRLRGAPVGNIWVRVSGYGMDGTATGTRHYIQAAWALQSVNKPIIVDNVGGLAGLSLLAFGAAGGLCHGLAEKESFKESNWRKTPHGGGSKRRIYFPKLDLYLTQD